MAWSDAVTEFLKFLNNIFVNPRRQIQKVINIYDTINRIIDETAVERFLIFKAHNGGGVIKPTGELYVSALYEGYCCHFHSVKSKYQKIEIDQEYARMLLELMQKGNLHFKTDKMREGLLKGVYKSEGVQEVRLYYLGQTKKFIFYCSAATSKNWDFTTEEKASLDISIGNIKQNMK